MHDALHFARKIITFLFREIMSEFSWYIMNNVFRCIFDVTDIHAYFLVKSFFSLENVQIAKGL